MTHTPEPELRLGKVLDFMRLLWAMDHSLQAVSKSMNARLEVTGPQRLVIRIVGLFPEISAGELADIMPLHPSTLTGILHRLVERGCISRTQDSADGRRALFHLTKKGQEIDAVRGGTVEAAVRRAIAGASPRQLAAASAFFRAIACELDREVDQNSHT
jgi:MarR family transcriptional regulator, organic hydroperoxide resistance regulator